MSYLNRPYGNEYCEAEREVIRESPYGSYSADYRVNEYENHLPHHNHNHNHHHHNGVVGVVKELVSDVVSGSRHNHHHHHGAPAGYIERREERIVDSSYDPYRRMY